MSLAIFYIFNKRYNSTKRPTDVVAYNIQVNLKQPTSLHNPTLKISVSNISMENMLKFNYCMFENQYYWVRDKRIMSNTILEFDMEEDVLATYTEEILATTAYVLYSENGSIYLRDNRLGIRTDYTDSTVEKEMSIFDTSAKFILTIANTTGLAACYLMTKTQMLNFGDAISSPTLLQQLYQYFSNPWESVISLQMTPFNISGSSEVINIASVNTGVSGSYFDVDTHIEQVYTLTVPKIYNDFRGHGEYTSAILDLPYVGAINIDMNRLATTTNLIIYLYAEFATGNIIYKLAQDDGTLFGYYSGNANSNIPISRQSKDITAFATSVISAVGGIENGSISAFFNGAVSAANAARITTSINGSISSSLSRAITNKLKMTLYSQNTQMSPTDITSTLGNPTQKCVLLSTLSGYVQTYNASISIEATSEEIQKVNDLLNGGIYIE